MWTNVKKALLSLSVVVLFALYAVQKQTQPSGEGALLAATLPATTIAMDRSTVRSIPASVPRTPTAPAPVQKPPTVSAPARTTSTMAPTATATTTAVRATQTPTPALATTNTTDNGAYRDGNYAGIEADAHWGTVQVLAIISNGQLSDVQFADYPNHRSRSVEINRQAIPILVREAIQSQQADVDIVSGATDTSVAFMQSLDSALRQATS